MARSSGSRPGRSLGVLLGLLVVIFGTIGAGTVWSNAAWTPKLGLDLEGGTQIVLSPRSTTGKAIDANALARSVEIIRNRVNGSGVSEAEVTTQGSGNIVVSLPGARDQKLIDLVQQSAQMNFRAVILYESTATTATSTSTATPTTSGTAGSTATATSGATATAGSAATASATASKAGAVSAPRVQGVLKGADSTAASTSAASTTSASSTSGTTSKASSSATPSALPSNASDTSWATQLVPGTQQTWQEKYDAMTCDKAALTKLEGVTEDLTQPLVTCLKDGSAKFLLGPSELSGTDIQAASASQETNSQGTVSGTSWQVNLEFTSKGADKFATVTKRLYAFGSGTVQNQFAIVLDGVVISNAGVQSVISGGQAQITGNFTQDEATALGNQLKFGALPISFTVQTEQSVSATLGTEQLERGLLAGLIGLVLVVIYSLLQYRALGTVTIASLTIAGVVTYGVVTFLSWRMGYRLSLAGVAGLIVSIGITADSFIVYFERVRDEVRDGRSITSAVESAWKRAQRTILVSDGVSLLAAIILYALSVSAVRGFAFTLGLTTVVDVAVVYLFTKPTVVLLSRTRFFGEGHKWSGFDPEHLGRAVVYAGRGKVRGGPTIAERRAAEQAAEQTAAVTTGQEH